MESSALRKGLKESVGEDGLLDPAMGSRSALD